MENGAKPGVPCKESYEPYVGRYSGREVIVYKYQHCDGDLFETHAPTVEEAREKCHEWLRLKRISQPDEGAAIVQGELAEA